MTIERFHSEGRMSQIVKANGTIYLAGQVASDPTADVSEQTRQVLAKIDGLLGEVGSNKARILSITVFLADIGDFATMNAVYDAWIDPAQKPARACVEAALATPAYKVELCVVAI